MVFENSQITEKYNKVVYKIGNTRNIFYINFIPSGFDIETYTQYSKDKDGKVIKHFTNMYIAHKELQNLEIDQSTKSFYANTTLVQTKFTMSTHYDNN